MSLKTQKIESYLSGPKEYEAGLNLYLEYGPSQVLKKILLLGATAYNHSKMIEALKDILHKAKESKPARPEGSPAQAPAALSTQKGRAPKRVSKQRESKPENGRFVVSPNHPELIRLYRERSALKAEIPHYKSQEKRKEAAFRILYIGEHIERILFTGLPGDNLPEDRAQLVKTFENNRKYLSKNKGRPEKFDELERRSKENTAIQNILDHEQKE